MPDHIFADAIVNVSVTGNLVRIDLGAVSVRPAGKDKKAETRMELSQRLVMPLEGFVRSVQMQEQIMAQLVKDGVIKVKKKDQTPIDPKKVN